MLLESLFFVASEDGVHAEAQRRGGGAGRVRAKSPSRQGSEAAIVGGLCALARWLV